MPPGRSRAARSAEVGGVVPPVVVVEPADERLSAARLDTRGARMRLAAAGAPERAGARVAELGHGGEPSSAAVVDDDRLPVGVAL